MHNLRTTQHRILAAALLFCSFGLFPAPAHAASKEIIALQTQVQQLTDMVQRIQSTLDTKFGIMQHLAEQTADSANRMSDSVGVLDKKLTSQTEATSGKIDAASGQVQALNDSVDELKSKISRLEKAIQDLQSQLQSAPAPQSAGPAAPGAPAAGANQAPPLQETFQAGVRDYNSAKYEVATGEFQDVVRYYPMDDLAGSAQFYLGEIAYRQQNFADAMKSYDAVLQGFPGSAKAPTAQLRKGLALLQLNKKAQGVQELRTLIQRHPQTPEAAQARSKLNGLGIKPSAAGSTR